MLIRGLLLVKHTEYEVLFNKLLPPWKGVQHLNDLLTVFIIAGVKNGIQQSGPGFASDGFRQFPLHGLSHDPFILAVPMTQMNRQLRHEPNQILIVIGVPTINAKPMSKNIFVCNSSGHSMAE